MKIFLSSWMRELDDLAINKIGIPSIILMEKAAQGAAEIISQQFPLTQYSHCLILIGKGNNGGDGLALARILQQKGYDIHFFLLFSLSNLKEDALINYHINRKLLLSCTQISSTSQWRKCLHSHHAKNTLIVDAIFGTGLNQPIQEKKMIEIIRITNQSNFPIVSLDVPSGISESFLPEETTHIKASITATFGGLKWSLLHPDGNNACGEIKVVDIGHPHKLLKNPKYYINLIEPSDFSMLLKPRPIDAHKGYFGHVLTIAGSFEKPGAGILSALSALKIGAGLVTAAIPFENRNIYIKAHPELMTLPYMKINDILNKIAKFDCLLVGPGLGKNMDNGNWIESILLECNSPLIIDADGLNVLCKQLNLLKKKRSYPLILTPHLGEFARLMEFPIKQILKNRIQMAREFAQKYHLYLVLKSHHTLVAAPNGNVYVNQTGNAGMAKAGSGDVLSGMLAGMVSQFIKNYDLDIVVPATVFLHGFAADLALCQKNDMSLMATDIINTIPDSIRFIHEFQSPFQFS